MIKLHSIFTWSYKFSKPGGGGDVTVAHRGHGDDGPVQSLRHRDEHRPLLVLLPDVGQPAEYQHPHDDHQHQQPQLLVAETDNNDSHQHSHHIINM